MARRIYNKDLLNETITRDTAVLVGDYPTLNLNTILSFVCKCGETTTRKFNYIIVSSGAFCRKCIINNSRDQAKKTCIDKYGVENPSQLDTVKDKKIETTLKHYGVENPFQSDKLKDKIKDTNLIKYGVENPLQNKEIMDKVKETCLQKYGATHNSKSEIIKEKKKTTSLTKFGVEHTLQVKEIRDKGKKTMMMLFGVDNAGKSSIIMDKVKDTMIKKFGVKNPSQSKEIVLKKKEDHIALYGVEYPGQRTEVKEKAKATNLIRYGVENAAQSQEIQEKAQKNAKKYKEFKFPSGAIRKVQGYEPIALRELVAAGYTEEQIQTDRKEVPRITYYTPDEKRHYYFPDIFIPHENRIIEVKSTWTYECKEDNIELKKQATLEKGYKYEIWCYDGKGSKVDLSTYTSKKEPISSTLSII